MNNDWLSEQRKIFELQLAQTLAHYLNLSELNHSSRLQEAMQYAMLNGGKRVRPLLCYAAGMDMGVSIDSLHFVAVAIEAVHVYSLVHDDLPCMDDDVLRRGKPTCHIAYDEPTAMLVGDALQSLAFESLSNSPFSSAVQIQHVNMLAQAIGHAGMAGGQQLDLMAPQQEDMGVEHLEMIHRKKTGALIEASIVMGALAKADGLTESDIKGLKQFGRALGLAFQVIDDILDATADTAALGKTAGKDLAQNKATYVRFMGIEQARKYANQLNEEARAGLKQCSRPMLYCKALQDWLIARTF
jgi:farnesyl diphosphate synthase